MNQCGFPLPASTFDKLLNQWLLWSTHSEAHHSLLAWVTSSSMFAPHPLPRTCHGHPLSTCPSPSACFWWNIAAGTRVHKYPTHLLSLWDPGQGGGSQHGTGLGHLWVKRMGPSPPSFHTCRINTGSFCSQLGQVCHVPSATPRTGAQGQWLEGGGDSENSVKNQV